MARIELITCDMPDPKTGKLCGEKGVVEATVAQGGKSYRTDLCEMHGQALVNAGQPITASHSAGYGTVTKLPKATGVRNSTPQLVEKIDYPDLRNWLEAQGKLKPGSKGRISQELQQMWVDAGEPRPT